MGTASTHQTSDAAYRAIMTACVMVATLMQSLDTTIVNVAMPYMQGSLAASPDQITWVLTSYIVAAAIMTPPVGWLAARYGRKNVFLVSLTGFVAASMLCGARNRWSRSCCFGSCRACSVQRLCRCRRRPFSTSFRPPSAPQAMAIWVMGVIVGPILGPTLGGYLTDFYNWRWVFYINLPLGILTISGLWIFMKSPRRAAASHFDFVGFAVLSLGLGALQLMLDRGEFKDWFGSTEIIVYAVLCGLGFYLFLVHMLTADAPIIPPRIFRDMNFVAGLLIIFLIGMLILAIAALLAPYLQTLSGRSVVNTGLLLAPRGVGTMIGVILAGRLGNRIDQRWMMIAGILLVAVTLWEMTGWTPGHRRLVIIPQFHGPGLRTRHRLYPASGCRLRHASGRDAYGRNLAVRPASQRGAGDRRIDDIGGAHAEHADRAFADRREPDRVQSQPAERSRLSLLEHREPTGVCGAQCGGHAAGLHHRLCRRLQAAFCRQPVDAASGAADASAGRRRRSGASRCLALS